MYLTQRKWFSLIIGLICLCCQQAYSSDLVEVLPASSSVLMLHYDDGHIDLYGPGGEWWQGLDNVVYTNALNLTNASNTANYSITSTDDGAWGTVVPTQVGRKSKGVDFQLNNGTPLYVSEHWIYLVLPKAMTSGRTYTVVLNGLANNLQSVTFTFDEKELRSETVRVNQIGFAPSARKIAYLSHWMGDIGHIELNSMDDKPFQIVRFSDKKVMYTGTINFRFDHDRTIYTIEGNNPANIVGTYKNHTYADIAECDFTSFTEPGEYVVSVPGIGCSFPFEISTSVVNEPFYVAMKGLFYQRAGIVQELPDGNVYPRDHHPDDIIHYYVGNDTTDSHSNYKGSWDPTNLGLPQVNGIWGWYHDASDWDMYASHYRIPILLMLLYDMYPDKFYDGEIGNRYKLHQGDASWIDEGSNGLPDILDEAGWLVQFGKRARHALLDQGLGTGGVPGYLGREGGAGGGLKASWEDLRPVAVTAENPTHTMCYAAVASQYAFALNAFHKLANPTENHPDYQMWIDEATAAYDWAVARGATDKSTGHGGMWTIAAFNLYRATGLQAYKDAVTANYGKNDNSTWHIEGANNITGFLAAGILALHPEVTIDVTAYNWANSKVLNQAQKISARNENVGLRYGAYDETTYELGMFANPKVMLLAVGHKITGNDSYLDNVQHQMSYVQGGNQLNTVHITMMGERPQNKGVHHIDSWVLNDATGPVYQWEPMMGISTYFGSNISWVTGPGDHHMTIASAYPIHNECPRSEMNFGNRESINGSEYTTNQTISSWAYAAGYIKAAYGSNPGATGHNPRPTVSVNLTTGQDIAKSGVFSLTATTSPDVRRVQYFYDWHFIGESTDKVNNFVCHWDVSKCNLSVGNKPVVTAVAYDDKGHISKASAGGAVQIDIVASGGVALSGIEVSPESNTMQIEDTLQLVVNFLPENATNKKVIWTTNKPLVAKVNQNGVVTALSPGTATIRAISDDGGFVAEATITIPLVLVEGVSVNPQEDTLTIGESIQLAAVLSPDNASDKTILWSSSNPAIASVSSLGQVTALSGGIVYITASTANATITASCRITILPAEEGNYRYLKVTFLAGNNLEVTEVEFFRQGIKYPQTAYDGSAGKNLFDHCISTSDNTCKTYYGSAFPYTATLDLGAGNSLSPDKVRIYKRTWSSLTSFKVDGSNDNTNWTLLQQFDGITEAGSFPNGANPDSGSFVFSSTSVPVSGITLSYTEKSMAIGSTFALEAVVSPLNATEKSVSWASDNESVATVDSTGLVTAVSIGTANISVTTTDGSLTAECAILVTEIPVAVTGVTLVPASVDLYVDGTTTLVAEIIPANATNTAMVWNTDNPDVATVDQNGQVTAIALGEATVSVTTFEGNYIGYTQVSVIPKAVSSVMVSPASYALEVNQTIALIATVEPEDAGNKNVSWESNHPEIANVSAAGLVTAVSPGVATITATTQDGGFSASSQITVNDIETSIYQSTNTGTIAIYPNPSADGQFTIDLRNFSGQAPDFATISDITGKALKSFTLDPSSRIMKLDNRGISEGIYYIRLQSKDWDYTWKVFVTK